MFCPKLIADGIRSDFDDSSIAAFASNAPRIAYGTAGFRTVGTSLPPVAYRCVFVVFCRSLNVRLSVPPNLPVDGHHHKGLINPLTIGDCGMMITASHNPAIDNGLKIIDPDGGMFSMAWEGDATEVANMRTPSAFAEALTAFAKQHLVMGVCGATEEEEEGPLLALLRDRPVRIHVGRDTRATGSPILASIKAAAATINRIFAPIVGGGCTAVVELCDHGVLTTPTLHAMVYWGRHRHELPVEELGLADPSVARSRESGTDANTIVAVASSANDLLMNRVGFEASCGPLLSAGGGAGGVGGGGVGSGSGSGAGGSSGSSGGGGAGGDDSAPPSSAASRRSLAVALTTPITRHLNERLIFRAFVVLWESMGLGKAGGSTAGKTIVIDCSNGVGSVTMREALALPISILPSDRAYLAKHTARHQTHSSTSTSTSATTSPLIPDGATETTIGALVEAVTGIRFVLVHTDVGDAGLLNNGCGADHTQKTRVPSSAFAEHLAAYVSAHKESLQAEVAKAPHGSCPTAVLCRAVGARIGFYCFDGDADRVVAFAPCPNTTTSASDSASSAAGDKDKAGLGVATLIASHTHFELLDGDRIAVLLSSLVRDALRRTSPTGRPHPIPQPQMGVVQTAYANGASTSYILKRLHIPTVCAATGVKYLHPKAEAMEVGIYFEANGHGTALSSAALFASSARLTVVSCPSSRPSSRANSGAATTTTNSRKNSLGRLGAGAVVPPGANAALASAAALASSGGADDSLLSSVVCTSAIDPSRWFGPGGASANGGLRNLLLLRLLLSQCCGDAIADMLACEAGLAALGWSAYDWQLTYSDLPSITGKTTVKDPSVIKNTDDQRQATAPAGLQDRIDAIVASVGGDSVSARCFVRPSGTEPIVRVYSEASTAEVTQQLFERVAAAVREMCD